MALWRKGKSMASPSAISTTPEATTTKSVKPSLKRSTWHLRHAGKAVESEVTVAGVGHEDTEQQAEEGFDVVHCAMKIVEVEYL